MSDTVTFDASGYWYAASSEQRGVDVLNALRRYRAAESEMRRRTRTSMRMGETDLKAIRFLLQSERHAKTVTPKQLANHLGITTASTSVLINRLVESGHLQRHSHPTDGRAVLLTATEDSNEEVRATLSGMHARMITIAESLPPEGAAYVAQFLEAMTEAVSDVDEVTQGHEDR